MKRRVAILISGRGSNMAALIEAARPKDFPAEIAVVISNRAEAAGLDRARAGGIATEIIESKPFGKDRGAFEAVLAQKPGQYRVEHRIYPEALRLLASGRLKLEGDLCRIEGGAGSGEPLIWPLAQ